MLVNSGKGPDTPPALDKNNENQRKKIEKESLTQTDFQHIIFHLLTKFRGIEKKTPERKDIIQEASA